MGKLCENPGRTVGDLRTVVGLYENIGTTVAGLCEKYCEDCVGTFGGPCENSWMPMGGLLVNHMTTVRESDPRFMDHDLVVMVRASWDEHYGIVAFGWSPMDGCHAMIVVGSRPVCYRAVWGRSASM